MGYIELSLGPTLAQEATAKASGVAGSASDASSSGLEVKAAPLSGGMGSDGPVLAVGKQES